MNRGVNQVEEIRLLLPVTYSIQTHEDRNKEQKKKENKEQKDEFHSKQAIDESSDTKNQIIWKQDIDLINNELAKAGLDIRVEILREKENSYIRIYSNNQNQEDLMIKQIPSKKLQSIITSLLTGEGVFLNVQA